MIVVRIKKTRFVIAAAVIAVLQQCVVHRAGSGHLNFDLFALLAAFTAITAPVDSALWAVLFLGLFRDLYSVGRTGAGALSFLPAVLLIWALKENFYRRTFLSDLAFSFIFMASFSMVYAGGMLLFSPPGPAFTHLSRAAGNAAYSALLVPPFFALFRIGGIIEEKKTTF